METPEENKPKKNVRGKDKVKRKPVPRKVAKQVEKVTIIKLTPLEEKACQAYVRIGTGSLTAAYKRAGYTWQNSKPETINKRASELFAKSHIKGRIAELEAAVQEKTILTVADLSNRLSVMIQSDPAGFFDEDGNILSVDQMQIENRMIIKDIETIEQGGKGRVRRVQSMDKAKLIEMMLRIQGGFAADHMQSKPVINQTFLDMSKLDSETLSKMKAAYVKKDGE